VNARASTAFVDVLFLIAMILILIPHGDERADPPLLGNVVVEATWHVDHDIDLWVKAPGSRAVGYSARQSGVTTLLLDDLGHNIDINLHREIVVVHGDEAPNGDYVANVHAFRLRGEMPAEIDVTLWVRKGQHLELYWTGHIRLGMRQEATAIRWSMRDGVIVPGSERFDFVSVRGSRGGGSIP